MMLGLQDKINMAPLKLNSRFLPSYTAAKPCQCQRHLDSQILKVNSPETKVTQWRKIIQLYPQDTQAKHNQKSLRPKYQRIQWKIIKQTKFYRRNQTNNLRRRSLQQAISKKNCNHCPYTPTKTAHRSHLRYVRSKNIKTVKCQDRKSTV